MKLSDIQNKEQFWQIGDVWYKRALRLADIWQNESETYERRVKAYYLWFRYKNAVLKLVFIASNFPNNRKKTYPSGVYKK